MSGNHTSGEHGRTRELERAEIEAFADSLGALPEGLMRAARVRVEDVAGLHAFAIGTADVLSFNRALGAGLEGPLTESACAAILRWFHGEGIPRFFVPLAPGPWADDARTMLESHGFRHYNNWYRLARDLGDLGAAPPAEYGGVRVREIGRDEGERFAAMLGTAFGFPPAMSPLVTSSIARPGWHHYLAELDGEPVGTAGLYVHGGVGWFGLASTAEVARGRGVQSSLIARRLADAKRAGCRVAVAETAEPKPEHDAPSSRNLRRLGFDVAYVRPNYIHEIARV